MATHDYVLANQSGSSFRTDLNNALAAVVSNNSNSSEPSTTYAYMLWVDTTNNLVKLRNSANNAWITLFTTAGGLDVDAASNFNEDVTFTGASANVTWDKSADDLIFADNAKAAFGTSSDLTIYHDGSDSYISHNGTGHLNIQTDGSQESIKLKSKKHISLYVEDGTELALQANESGAVELYYDNVKTFETESDGIAVIGPEGGNAFITFKADEGDDNADLFDVGVYNGGPFKIQNKKSGSWEDSLVITGNGAVELYHDNSKKLSTGSGGIVLHGSYYTNDGNSIYLGSGNDLRLYHDGNNSYLDNTTGDVYLRQNGSENSAKFIKNGAVELYYDDSIKARTDSTGFLVDTGYLRACNDGNFTNLSNDSHGLRVTNDNWGLRVINSHASTNYGIEAFFNNSHPDDSTSRFFAGRDDQTNRFVVYSDGDVANHDGTYGQTSDIKLKENIVDASSQWDDIKAVRVRNFNFKIDDPSKRQIGVVAQELETVCPGLVKDNPDLDENNKDLGTTTKSVKSSILYMKAIKALQEAMAKIETLETKVAALEAK
jgi:hypothetical protein